MLVTHRTKRVKEFTTIMYVHVSELSEFNKQEPIPMQPRFYTGVYREIDFAISEAWRPDNSISDILIC